MTKLTQRTIDALKVGSKARIEFDDDLKGFGLKIYPSDRRAWVVEYRPGGGGRRVNKSRMTIGSTAELSPEEARNSARKILADVIRGEDPAAARNAMRKAATVSEVLDRFLAEYVPYHYAATTKIEVIRHIKRNIRPVFGNRRLSELARSEIKRWHSSFRDRPTEGNLALAYFAKILSVASVEWELRADNPARGISKFPTKPRDRVYDNDEIRRFGASLDELAEAGRIMPGAIVAFRLIVLTTMRRGDVLALEWSMIDMQRGKVRLPDGKNGFRVVPIGTAVLSFLATLPRDGKAVCPGVHSDRPISLSTYNRAWKKLRNAAGLRNAMPHDWRHTGANMIAQDGASAFVLQGVTGHRTLATTQRYVNDVKDASKASADRMSENMGALLRNEASAEVIPLHRSKASPKTT